MPTGPKPKNSNAGHFKRLRERFTRSGLDGFLDYEIVELLLTLGGRVKDCKQEAKALIKKHRGLRGVLDAPVEELTKIRGIGRESTFGLKLFQAISERYAHDDVPSKITLNSARAVAGYLQAKIGRAKKENFIALYLDARHRLIHEELISVGTLNASLVHPREVFKPAIDHLAASVIVAHNHPSGGTEPSAADLELTRRLREAGRLMGVELTDHLIITQSDFRSII